MTEHEMVTSVVARLREAGKVGVPGVPFMSRCIDLVIVGDDESIAAIEFKLHDWQRGITQARDHLLGADYAFVCLPQRRPDESLKAAFEDSGIGLLFFDPDSAECLREIVPPSRSDAIWPPARRWLVQAALDGMGEGAPEWDY